MVVDLYSLTKLKVPDSYEDLGIHFVPKLLQTGNWSSNAFMFNKMAFKNVLQGSPGGSVKRLPSAGVMISGSRDQAPCW